VGISEVLGCLVIRLQRSAYINRTWYSYMKLVSSAHRPSACQWSDFTGTLDIKGHMAIGVQCLGLVNDNSGMMPWY
jgi:hypothetical protein